MRLEDSSFRPAYRILLILAAFTAGASIMIIELAGNRILAPMFGNTLYTWTGLIGVILTAMSAGYYFGGRLSDREPNHTVLAHLILVAAIFTFLVPLLQRVGARFFTDKDIVWGPSCAAFSFFAVPAFFLGAAAPFAMRLASLISYDKHIGLSAGYIGMVSTLGSVIGTFGTGFLLIPKVGVRTIFMLVGAALTVLAMAFYIVSLINSKRAKKHILFSFIILILLPATILCTERKSNSRILFDQTTFYHRILVNKEARGNDFVKALFLDTSHEGAQYEYSTEAVFPYQGYWKLAHVFCPTLEKALFLGGGAFYMPERLSKAYPKADVEVAEIDPQVQEVGKKFFHVAEYPLMKITIADARRYLAEKDVRYNLIFGDVYSGLNNIPAHLVTEEFFSLVKRRLSRNGVYMMNVISSLRGEKSHLLLSIVRTLRQVFDKIYVFAINPADSENLQNVIIVAPMNTQNTIAGYSGNISDPAINSLLSTQASLPYDDKTGSVIFTDDYSPVEYLVAKSLN